MGLGLHLGGVWDGLGRLLGTFGRFWTVFLVFYIDLFSSIGLRWGPRGLLDQFWVDFGRSWEGFGRILQGFWEGFGSFLEFYGAPALSREAPRSVPMRGGPRPPVC